MSRVKNHRICIHGHQTCVRMESEIWLLLRRMAVEIGTTATRLIEAISIAKSPDRSLSSEIRVCVATHLPGGADRLSGSSEPLGDPCRRRPAAPQASAAGCAQLMIAPIGAPRRAHHNEQDNGYRAVRPSVPLSGLRAYGVYPKIRSLHNQPIRGGMPGRPRADGVGRNKFQGPVRGGGPGIGVPL
jgi:predicted DNA-binding ribbon-helix-helix protein